MRLPQKSASKVEGARADARACPTASGTGIAAAAAGPIRFGRTSLGVRAGEKEEDSRAGEVTRMHIHGTRNLGEQVELSRSAK